MKETLFHNLSAEISSGKIQSSLEHTRYQKEFSFDMTRRNRIQAVSFCGLGMRN
jgi:hypothetical protein